MSLPSPSSLSISLHTLSAVKIRAVQLRPAMGWAWTALGYRVFIYLLLLPELDLHLLVPELVFADAVSGNEVAADISQLWVLFPCLLDQAENTIAQLVHGMTGF